MKITIHKMKTVTGNVIEYARTVRKCGPTLVCQSVMLNRLSSEQIKAARRNFK